MPRISSIVVLGASLLAGCAHARGARDVTPWLRIEGWRPSDFPLAESGQNHDRFAIRQKVDGRWRTLTDDGGSDCAFAFAGGARAVVSKDLLSVDGPLVHLACAGEVRGTPSGDAIDCFENQGPGNAAGWTIRHFDRDGRAIGARRVAVPADVLPLPSFVGYRGDDLVYLAADGGRCASYLLHPDDRIEALAAPGDCETVRRMAESIATPGIVQRQLDGRRCL